MPGSVAGAPGGGWEPFAARWAKSHGGFDPRTSSAPVRAWFRLTYLTGRALAGMRVSPDVVTAVGLGFSLLVPIVAFVGGAWMFVAAGLVVVAAIADSADGAVAVLSERSTALGAYRDSVADRISEAAWLVGLWLAGNGGWGSGGLGLLVAVCGALAWLHEYMRARAIACGLPGIGVVTVAERPTRVIVVVAAFLFGGLAWLINPKLTPGAITVILAFWALLSLLGTLKLNGAIRAGLRT